MARFVIWEDSLDGREDKRVKEVSLMKNNPEKKLWWLIKVMEEMRKLIWEEIIIKYASSNPPKQFPNFEDPSKLCKGELRTTSQCVWICSQVGKDLTDWESYCLNGPKNCPAATDNINWHKDYSLKGYLPRGIRLAEMAPITAQALSYDPLASCLKASHQERSPFLEAGC